MVSRATRHFAVLGVKRLLPRFLAPDLDPSTGTATLSGGEAHHLVRVLRLGAGDEVAIFDGRGREFRARVERIAGAIVTVRVLEPIASAPERQVPITLAQAVLKGTSMDDVVRDATMMGVGEIVPIVSAHTVARKAASPHGTERWRRVAIASAKQCRRAWIPDVSEAQTFDAWVGQPRTGVTLLLVEPSIRGIDPMPMRALTARETPPAAALVVGPEGGWSAEEVRAAVAGGHVAVTLGPMTLRAEAVPLAALAALSVIWD